MGGLAGHQTWQPIREKVFKAENISFALLCHSDLAMHYTFKHELYRLVRRARAGGGAKFFDNFWFGLIKKGPHLRLYIIYSY